MSTPDDEQDADLILKLVELVRGRQYLTKIIRDDIDYIWAKPRETKQGHRKRAVGAWWSPDAYELRDQTGTIGEHIVPMDVVSKRMLDLLNVGALNRGTLLKLLRIPMAVITKHEDCQLRKAKFAKKMPGELWAVADSDWEKEIWGRYAAAKLPIVTFRQMGRDGDLLKTPPPGY